MTTPRAKNVKRQLTQQNLKRQRTQAGQVPHNSLHTYLIRTLRAHLAAMQQDLIECQTVRQRTEADIKHIHRQIAALNRKRKAKKL